MCFEYGTLLGHYWDSIMYEGPWTDPHIVQHHVPAIFVNNGILVLSGCTHRHQFTGSMMHGIVDHRAREVHEGCMLCMG